VATDNLKANDM